MAVEAQTAHSLETVPSMFIRAARENANRVALEAQDGTLTYWQLQTRASQLAGYLRTFEIGRESLVALCIERSANLVTAMLGSLLAAAAYAPLDTSNPAERLRSIIGESKADFLLVDGANAARFEGLDVPTLKLGEEAWRRLEAVEPVVAYPCPQDLAYVVYTSGSTGTPKGCELEHRTLAHVTRWQAGRSEIRPGDRCLQFVAQGFDILQMEVWPALTTGAAVVVVDQEARLDPRLLRDRMVAWQITSAFLPTPIAERLLRLEWPRSAMRLLATGGEALHSYPSPDLPFKLVNVYGPAECSVVSTGTLLEPDPNPTRLPPIGFPVDGVHMHVVDEGGDEVERGQPGEMWIAGDNVGRGYRHRPDLTGEKFGPDPFCPGRTRLYKSGDIVRWSDRGDLEFIGRIDNQVKIRGFRIELGEIEAVLLQQPSVQEAVVVAREDTPGNKRLVAYLTSLDGSKISPTELRSWLTARLPEYMIPAVFVGLDALPVTANGKHDRAALPIPDDDALERSAYGVPCTLTEQQVSAVWAELLGLDRVGVDDNFFDLGGHSLLAAQLVSRLRDMFGVEIPLASLFAAPTLADLCAAVDEAMKPVSGTIA